MSEAGEQKLVMESFHENVKRIRTVFLPECSVHSVSRTLSISANSTNGWRFGFQFPYRFNVMNKKCRNNERNPFWIAIPITTTRMDS